MKCIKKAILTSICVILLGSFSFLNTSALVIFEGDFGFEVNSRTQKATVVDFTGNDTVVSVPGSYSGYPVTKVAASAFSGNSNITIMNLPTSIKTIESGSFESCEALREIYFPSTIENLGSNVCLNCNSLETVELSAKITSIPQFAFAGCVSLTSISVNETISSIGKNAFQYCSSLENVNLPKNVNTISEYAFDHSGICELTIPDAVSQIKAYSFANCEKLNRININRTITDIDTRAFYNDPNLTLGVWYGSYGHEYAIAQDLSYVLLDGVKLGDANGDDNININDVTAIQRHLAQLEQIEGIYLYAADANQDGTLDISDATSLQMYLAEYDIPYPIGEVMTQ